MGINNPRRCAGHHARGRAYLSRMCTQAVHSTWLLRHAPSLSYPYTPTWRFLPYPLTLGTRVPHHPHMRTAPFRLSSCPALRPVHRFTSPSASSRPSHGSVRRVVPSRPSPSFRASLRPSHPSRPSRYPSRYLSLGRVHARIGRVRAHSSQRAC